MSEENRKRGRRNRRRGGDGERELRALLRDELGDGIKRNLEQARGGGHDLIGLYPFALEIKRKQRITEYQVRTCWNQATVQAHGSYSIPALAYRADRQPWRVVIPMYAVDKHQLGAPSHDYEWTAELSLAAFCAVVREHMANARPGNGG